MTEPFFFNRGSGLSVREIAALTGAKLQSGAHLDRRITGIAALDHAAPSDLAFLDKAKYAPQLSTSAAGACLTTQRYAGHAGAHTSVLCIAEPYRAFVEVAQALSFPKIPSVRIRAMREISARTRHTTRRPTIWGYRNRASLVRIASPLRADMIFGKARFGESALKPLRQRSSF
jgi:hypothetical protein